MTRDEFIGVIQNAAKARNTNRLTFLVFLEQTGITRTVATKALRIHFHNSWAQACRAAGVEWGSVYGENQLTHAPIDVCIAELKRVAAQLGVTTLSRELYSKHAAPGFHANTIIQSFHRRWTECLKIAGLDSCDSAVPGWGLSSDLEIDSPFADAGPAMTRDEFIGAIQNAAKARHTNRLTFLVFLEQSGVGKWIAMYALRKHFNNSWSEACRAAGIERGLTLGETKNPPLPFDEFVGAIQNAAKARNTNRLTFSVFLEQSGIAMPVAQKALRKHFYNSWSEACRAAGIERGLTFGERQIRRPSVDVCIAELKRVAEHLGVTALSRELYRKHAGPGFSPSTIIRSFRKEWPACLEAAGLDSCDKAKLGWGLSREECIEELRRIAASLPPGTELSRNKFESANPKFKSNRIMRGLNVTWRKALAAAGLEPSSAHPVN